MEPIRYIPNIITGLRIAGSLILLTQKPLSAGFFLLYFFCGLTDGLDGLIARKTDTASAAGAALDSAADAVFIAVMLFLLVPVLPFAPWMILWTAGIGMIRIGSWAAGFIKYRTFVSLHTYGNKTAGFVLFCFPLLWKLWGISTAVAVICTISSLSAIEELILQVTSRELHRNETTIFCRLSRKRNKG
ncbi:CDP-alcohol phosphatidyltransferase family protein [Lachnospiraceae bacterium 54-53]